MITFLNPYPGEGADDSNTLDHLVGLQLPKEYLELLAAIPHGAEGTINGDDSTGIRFWGLADLIDDNRDYEIQLDHPGLFAFATDYANVAYAFDTRRQPMPVIQISLIDPYFEEPVGQDFIEFLVKIGEIRSEDVDDDQGTTG